MSYHSEQSLEDAQEAYREHCAMSIAQIAAGLVAAGDMGRHESVDIATEWVRLNSEADGDFTRTIAVQNKCLTPSRFAPPGQVAAIANALLEPAREAFDRL